MSLTQPMCYDGDMTDTIPTKPPDICPPTCPLSAGEHKVLHLSTDLYNAFCDLPNEHSSDIVEFVAALHRIQDLVYSRPGRRLHWQAGGLHYG